MKDCLYDYFDGVGSDLGSYLGRNHPIKFITIILQVGMINYTHFAMLFTAYLMHKDEVSKIFPYGDSMPNN